MEKIRDGQLHTLRFSGFMDESPNKELEMQACLFWSIVDTCCIDGLQERHRQLRSDYVLSLFRYQ